jgi:hypothetical protein
MEGRKERREEAGLCVNDWGGNRMGGEKARMGWDGLIKRLALAAKHGMGS